jgi:phosphate:Na+ symporter
MLITLFGGIGLFLLGMVLMTDGLKSLAGDSLRSLLGRFASGPISSLVAGAGLTVLVQSSHATTLATIGFVSSGLLSFQQALGVIFGANLGTTSTGWLVAVLGIKFNIASLAFLFIGAGSLMKLLGRERVAAAGMAAAGFGLIFIGIDTLQDGMSELSKRIDPAALPRTGLVGRLLLVGFGLVMTVIMQSSSAAIATTLTALNSGTITIDQAACLVVGQNIGSSVTAAFAAIGASVPAKRTAVAHILFNALTGLVAFLILPLFVRLVEAMADTWMGGNDELALAGFHTLFNVLGVSLFLPFTAQFARLVMAIVPDRGPVLTRHLGPTIAREPQAAVEAVHTTLSDVLLEQSRLTLECLRGGNGRDLRQQRDDVREALRKTADFISHLPGHATSEVVLGRRLSAVHALDHLTRLEEALREEGHVAVLAGTGELAEDIRRVEEGLNEARRLLASGSTSGAATQLEALSKGIAETRRQRRETVLAHTAAGAISPELGLKELDAIRWVDRLAFHTWRAAAHLYKDREPVVANGFSA